MISGLELVQLSPNTSVYLYPTSLLQKLGHQNNSPFLFFGCFLVISHNNNLEKMEAMSLTHYAA